MESLALLALLIICIMLISSFLAIGLTFRKTQALSNVTLRPFQRILTILFASISLFIGVQISINIDSLGGRLIGGFGIATAVIAFYRVIKK